MISIRLLVPALFAVVAAAQPVAMVVDLTGGASWELMTPVHITDEVAPGRLLILEKGARLVLIHLRTGTEQVFTGPARISLKADGSLEGGKAASTRKIQALQGAIQLKPSALAQTSVIMKELGAPEGPLREAAPPWPLLQPAGPCIQDPSQAFAWQALPQAKYTFRITDDQTHPVFEATGSEPRVKLPSPSPLAGKGVYLWFLRAELPDGSTRAASGSFRLLDEAARGVLRAAKPGEGASFADRLLYALLLDQLEVKDEARTLWQALARERPEEASLRRISRD